MDNQIHNYFYSCLFEAHSLLKTYSKILGIPEHLEKFLNRHSSFRAVFEIQKNNLSQNFVSLYRHPWFLLFWFSWFSIQCSSYFYPIFLPFSTKSNLDLQGFLFLLFLNSINRGMPIHTLLTSIFCRFKQPQIPYPSKL